MSRFVVSTLVCAAASPASAPVHSEMTRAPNVLRDSVPVTLAAVGVTNLDRTIPIVALSPQG